MRGDLKMRLRCMGLDSGRIDLVRFGAKNSWSHWLVYLGFEDLGSEGMGLEDMDFGFFVSISFDWVLEFIWGRL